MSEPQNVERALDQLVAARQLWEARVAASRQLATVGSVLWSSVLVGNPAPMVEQLRERMRAIRPGDLVIEISPRFGQDFDPDSLGTLIRVELEDPGSPSNWRYVIEPMHAPGTEQGWTNAEFIALPTDHLRAWAYAPSQLG